MSYTALFSSRARQEFLKAWEWYEDRQEGLGGRFRDEVYKQVYNICQHPERYPERKKNYHEACVSVFPYLIIYRLRKQSKEILIVSVFHSRRSLRRKYSK